MKAYNFMLAAAIVMLAACTEDPYAGMGTKPVTGEKPSTDTPSDGEQDNPGVVEKTVTFTAIADGGEPAAEGDEQPAAKAVVSNDGTKLQTFWEPGDEIKVWSDADPSTGYIFATDITTNYTSADFTYTGAFQEGARYIAVHPAKGSTCTFDNSTITGAVVIPSNQTLEAGRIKKDYLAALAYSERGNTLAFRNATALVKFQVGDERVYSGTVQTSEGEQIGGTYTATFDSNGIPAISTTNDKKETITFKPESGALATGTDYYVAVAPVDELAGGFTLTFNNNYTGRCDENVHTCNGTSYISKTYNVKSLERNVVYNVADAMSNTNVSKIELHFHFDDADCYDWPTSSSTLAADEIVDQTFTLNGQDFTFKFAGTLNGGKRAPYNLNTSSYSCVLLTTQESFLGLPALADFKLTEVSVINKGAVSSSTACILGERATVEGEKKYVGESKSFTQGGTTSWTLEGTTEGQVCWLYVDGGTRSLHANHIYLTYEKVE